MINIGHMFFSPVNVSSVIIVLLLIIFTIYGYVSGGVLNIITRYKQKKLQPYKDEEQQLKIQIIHYKNKLQELKLQKILFKKRLEQSIAHKTTRQDLLSSQVKLIGKNNAYKKYLSEINNYIEELFL